MENTLYLVELFELLEIRYEHLLLEGLKGKVPKIKRTLTIPRNRGSQVNNFPGGGGAVGGHQDLNALSGTGGGQVALPLLIDSVEEPGGLGEGGGHVVNLFRLQEGPRA